jgi:hypothetical protein
MPNVFPSFIYKIFYNYAVLEETKIKRVEDGNSK